MMLSLLTFASHDHEAGRIPNNISSFPWARGRPERSGEYSTINIATIA